MWGLRLREAFPNARLTIAGEGPLEATVRALASDLGVAGAVSFAGFLSEEGLVRLYSESHVFVHPSQLTADQNQEGVPNSMLEAMATGLPVVATLHGGIPEAVTDGKSGLLVPERDVDGLTEALLNVTGDAALRSRLGRTAASDVRDRFGSDAQIANLETIYKEAMTHG